MGYLGLDETPVKDDNLFQRIFWPSDHAGEVDTLGKQGFWICLGIALISGVTVTLQGHPILGALTFLFYLLAGVGVREHSQPAAMLVAVAYLLNVVATVLAGAFPGFLTIFITLLLFANVRATWIADKWARSGDPDAMPERMNQTFADKLVDRMPAAVWPRAKIPFFCIAGLFILLTIAGTIMVAMHLNRLKPVAEEPPSATLEVTPSR